MSTIRLEIVSPDRGEIFADDISMLIVRTIGGELGILPGHARLLTELIPFSVRIKPDGGGEEKIIVVGGGYLEVTPKKITILARSAENPDDIDVDRATSAYKRAAGRLADFKNAAAKTGEEERQEEVRNIKRAEAALARAKARLLVKNVSVESL